VPKDIDNDAFNDVLSDLRSSSGFSFGYGPTSAFEDLASVARFATSNLGRLRTHGN